MPKTVDKKKCFIQRLGQDVIWSLVVGVGVVRPTTDTL